MPSTSSNPQQTVRPGDRCCLVIFGASGDLTKRKLLPSLYNLAKKDLLPKEFALVGCANQTFSEDEFRTQVREDLKQFADAPDHCKFCDWLIERLYYLPGDFQDPAYYQRLKPLLAQVDQKHGTQGNYFYYLATTPSLFGEVVRQLGGAGLAEENGGHWRRIVFEKPFGHDLDSARALNREIKQVLTEDQIYRIDHYLGKETVQNILVFRFSNGIFEPIWNRRYIDHVQITVAETLGVELRGAYYDHAGALRDMVPNHIFQMLSLIAMEPPVSFSAQYIGDEKVKALHAVQVLTPEQVLERAVRGQYDSGKINHIAVPGYRSEKNIASESSTETYFALKLFLDNWRWLDVPFYIRTGKRMKVHTTEIIVQFKSGPSSLFSGCQQKAKPNLLRIYIQIG